MPAATRWNLTCWPATSMRERRTPVAAAGPGTRARPAGCTARPWRGSSGCGATAIPSASRRPFPRAGPASRSAGAWAPRATRSRSPTPAGAAAWRGPTSMGAWSTRRPSRSWTTAPLTVCAWYSTRSAALQRRRGPPSSTPIRRIASERSAEASAAMAASPARPGRRVRLSMATTTARRSAISRRRARSDVGVAAGPDESGGGCVMNVLGHRGNHLARHGLRDAPGRDCARRAPRVVHAAPARAAAGRLAPERLRQSRAAAAPRPRPRSSPAVLSPARRRGRLADALPRALDAVRGSRRSG